MRLIPAICMLLASALPAAAVPATPEGAARIEAAFRKVLGPLPGMVTVTPQGATYSATVDFSPLIKLIPEPSLAVTVTPYAYTLTDNGDGTWGLSEEQDFALSISMPGMFEASYVIESIRAQGVFDENLVALTSYRAETGPVSMTTKATAPDGSILNDDKMAADGMVWESTATAGASGGVDVDSHMTISNYTQEMAIPVASGEPPSRVSVTMASYATEARFQGFRSAELVDLIGFFVARTSPDRIIADQDMLRVALNAVMPLFGRIESDLTFDAIAAETPVGPVSADQMALSIGLNGVVKDGKFSEGISVKGLSLPPGLMPAWAEKLLPKDATVGFALSGFNLADPAKVLIDSFDLTKPEPIGPEIQFGLLAALVPNGMVEIAITPSSASSDLYGIEATGLFTAGMMVPPSGRMQVSASGLDAVQATLDTAADDPDAAGLRGAIGIARALATTGADGRLAWEIEFTADEKVLVNGTDVTGAP